MNKKRQIIVKVKRASMKGMYRGGGLLLSKRLVVLIKEIEPSFATHLQIPWAWHGQPSKTSCETN